MIVARHAAATAKCIGAGANETVDGPLGRRLGPETAQSMVRRRAGAPNEAERSRAIHGARGVQSRAPGHGNLATRAPTEPGRPPPVAEVHAELSKRLESRRWKASRSGAFQTCAPSMEHVHPGLWATAVRTTRRPPSAGMRMHRCSGRMGNGPRPASKRSRFRSIRSPRTRKSTKPVPGPGTL